MKLYFPLFLCISLFSSNAFSDIYKESDLNSKENSIEADITRQYLQAILGKDVYLIPDCKDDNQCKIKSKIKDFPSGNEEYVIDSIEPLKIVRYVTLKKGSVVEKTKDKLVAITDKDIDCLIDYTSKKDCNNIYDSLGKIFAEVVFSKGGTKGYFSIEKYDIPVRELKKLNSPYTWDSLYGKESHIYNKLLSGFSSNGTPQIFAYKPVDWINLNHRNIFIYEIEKNTKIYADFKIISSFESCDNLGRGETVCVYSTEDLSKHIYKAILGNGQISPFSEISPQEPKKCGDSVKSLQKQGMYLECAIIRSVQNVN